MLFQVFRLNLADISKMYYFSNKFSKLPRTLGALRPQRTLIFDFGDLKLSDVAKFVFFLS